MRILIYTGKGGVGKTSIAAATAIKIAKSGKKVLIMSTDQAHSLRDSFALSEDEQPDIPGLTLLEVNTVEESRKAWGSLQDYLKEIVSKKAEGGLAADEALMFPGLEELFALLRVLDAYESGEYDCIIVDCAPTGETLSLLRYPERLSVAADKILPMVRNMTRTFGSFISRKTSVPKPKDAVFAEFEKLVKRLNVLRDVLQNRETTSLRLVMSPERIVIDEARRSYTWLSMYDFGVDGVYVNRIYPEEALKGYFEDWAFMQQESLRLVEESFPNQKRFHLYMQEDELRGVDALTKVAEYLYGEEILADDLYIVEPAFVIENHGATRHFLIPLPYANADEINVDKDDKDLILTFKNEIRRFRLPDMLVRRYISEWSYDDKILRILMDYD